MVPAATPPSGGGGKVRDMVASINSSYGSTDGGGGGGSGLGRVPANSLSAVGTDPSDASPRRATATTATTRAALTKSSDDLLRSYGLDFSKLSTAGAGVGAGAGAGAVGDPFADLDPLRQRKTSPSTEAAFPSAPPRAKRQQNWTTFE